MSALSELLTGFTREVVNFTGMVLALAQLCLVWYCLYVLVHINIQQVNHDLVLVAVTAILTKYGTTIDWFYGGSKQKPTTPVDTPPTGATPAVVSPITGVVQ